MRRTIAGCLLAVWLGSGLASGAANAQVVPEISYQYYTVRGEGGRLLDPIVLKIPSGTQVIGYDRCETAVGMTESGFTFNYSYSRPLIDVCRVEEITVTCVCRITLPALEGGDGTLRAAFTAFQERIKAHELEHCRITTLYANKFLETVRRLDDLKCGRLEATVKKEFERLRAESNGEQARFDHREGGASWERFRRDFEARFLAQAAPPPIGQLKNLDQGQKLSDQGFYKDSDGVWRNHGSAMPTEQDGEEPPEEAPIYRDQDGVWRSR